MAMRTGGVCDHKGAHDSVVGCAVNFAHSLKFCQTSVCIEFLDFLNFKGVRFVLRVAGIYGRKLDAVLIATQCNIAAIDVAQIVKGGH